MTGDAHFSLLLGFVQNFVNTITSPVMVCPEEKNQCLVHTFRIHSETLRKVSAAVLL